MGDGKRVGLWLRPGNLELQDITLLGPGEKGWSISQPLCGQQAAKGGFLLLTSSSVSWQALVREVRLDEVALSANEAVLGGEMRWYWKMNEVVQPGMEVVLGGIVDK